jgi:TonB family protein
MAAVNQFSPPGLFAETPRQPHSWAAVTISAALHAAVIPMAVFFARDAVSAALPRASRVLTFVTMLPAPDPALVAPLEMPRLPERIPRAQDAAPLPPADIPVPERPPEIVARVQPRPPTPPVGEAAPKVEPLPRAVQVGAFATNVAPAHAFETAPDVRRAGFDAPAARAPEMKTGSAAAGAFDQPAAARPQPGSDRPGVVENAGFGTAAATATAPSAPRAIANAGFGAGRADAPRAQTQQAVRTTDFDARGPAAAVSSAPRAVQIDVAVEILSKPTPAYTDEARAKKLEGEVVLEVQFAAAGDIRILRVVRGLGYGLDESAKRAAEGMRFKPAQSGGHPIDFTTTVHIVFRLA